MRAQPRAVHGCTSTRHKLGLSIVAPQLTVEVEYLGEDWEVDILVPGWAMHKLKGGEPSDAFEDEGGESMWELYVKDQGEIKAKRAFEERAAKEK